MGGNYHCNFNVGSEVGGATGSITYIFNGGTPVTLPLTNSIAQFSLTTPDAGPPPARNFVGQLIGNI